MKQISITKSGILTNQATFETQELADAWLAKHIAIGSFGSPDRYEQQPIIITPAVYEVQPALIEEAVFEDQEILDENQESFDPPQFESVEITPAVYEDRDILITDAVYETEEVLIKEAVLDEELNEIEPAEYETRTKMIDVLVAPAEYTIIDEDITNQVALQVLIADKRAKGKKASDDCNAVLELIGGYNIDRELTFAQKNEMKILFADAKSALDDKQPGYAKYFILQIVPDEVLCATEMRDICLQLLSDWNIPQ